jgi:ribosome-associated protein
MIDVTKELKFQTARSGGSGGQNVNKVETMVEAYFDIDNSKLLTTEQKEWIKLKLVNRIDLDGVMLVKNQTERTQLGNKKLVIQKVNELINAALVRKKKRIPTKTPKVIKEKILETKKKRSTIKEGRKKINKHDL